MGQDKALLPFPGDPGHSSNPARPGSMKKPGTFLEQLVCLLGACCAEVLIVARDREQAARYAYTGARIVLDSIPGGGPLVGLARGLQAIASPAAILAAVDMPFITSPMLAFLISHYQDGAMLVPVVNGHPQVTMAIYPRSILPFVEERIRQGRRDLRCLLDDAPVQYVDEAELRQVDPELRSFIGINTPEELRTLKL
jgi:molybdopterin-guanine dinucleotide biosynthesis protein A